MPGCLEEDRLDTEGLLKIFPVAKFTEILMLNKTDWDKFASAMFLKWVTEARRNAEFSAGSGYLPVKKEANNAELFLETVEQEEKRLFQRNLGVALPVAISVVNTHETYSSKAFDGGEGRLKNVHDSYMNGILRQSRG